jgi:6-phosphofructokinase 1
MNEQFVVPSLGNCRIQSPLPLSTSSKEDNFRFVEDSQRILYQATFNNLDQHELFGGESPVSFEAAGPRAMTFFDASKVRAGMVCERSMASAMVFRDLFQNIDMTLWN